MRIILPPFSGVFTGLVVSYFVPAALGWMSMAAFLYIIFDAAKYTREWEVKKTVRHGLRLGFSYFYPYYLLVWYWFLTMYPLDFTGLSKPAAFVAIMFAWLGLPLLQALFAMLQVPIFLLISRSRFITGKKGNRLTMPILYSLIYVVFEWSQILTWAGVPWGRLAIGQAYTPVFVAMAALFGSYFITFIIVSVNGYVTFAASAIAEKETRRGALALSLAAVIFAANLVGGTLVNVTRKADVESERCTVGLAQGNISSTQKWTGGFEEKADVYGRLTEKAANDGAEIVVWTETSFPYVVNESMFSEAFIQMTARNSGVSLLATSFWREPDGVKYNVVMTVSPEGQIDTENLYHKQRLVPFGEFVPYEELVKALVPPLASLSMFGSTVGAGGGASCQDTEVGKIGTLICFDSIYEEYSMAAVRDGAEILTISTNDSWFGTSAALYQHTAQGILRAIETDRYIARAANTGYSCVISPSGEILKELPLEAEGYIVTDIYRRDTRTLYSHIGNLFVLLSALAALAVGAESLIYNKMKKK